MFSDITYAQFNFMFLLAPISFVCTDHLQFPSIHFSSLPNHTVLNQTLKDSLMLTKSCWEYPIISNLDQYLLPISGETCLIVLDNFVNIDIPQTSKPAIVRWTNILTVGEHAELSKKFQLSDSNTQNFSPTNIPRCTTSPYFQCDDTFTCNFCLELNRKQFTIKTKPWKCQMHFTIYPPLHDFSNLRRTDSDDLPFKLPKLFSGSSRLFWEPSQIPSTHSLNILIRAQIEIQDEKGMMKLNYNDKKTWMTAISIAGTVPTEANMYFVLTVKCYHHNRKGTSLELTPSGKVVKIEEIKVRNCPDCFFTEQKEHWRFESEWMKIFPMNLSAVRKLAEASAKANERFTWKLFIDREASIIDKIETFLVRGVLGQAEEGKNTYMQFVSPKDRTALGLAQVFHAVMRNYTIIMTGCYEKRAREDKNLVRCIIDKGSDIRVDLVPFLKSSYHTAFAVQEPAKSFRFVSCGNRGHTSIPFQELINVYSSTVWIFILMSCLIIAVTLLGFLQNKSKDRVRLLLVPVKVFLEQGDPFGQDLIDIPKLRGVFGCFLLMGVILSNGYKYTNVYRLIAPKKSIPLNYFEELIKYNFTVYTRSGHINHQITGNIPSRIPCRGNATISSSSKDIRYCVHLEINLAEESWQAFVWLRLRKQQDNENIQPKSQLSQKGVLTWSQFNVTYVQDLGKIDVDYRNRTAIDRLKATVQVTELKHLQQRMHMCNRVAVILPEHLCYKFVHDLKSKGFHDAFVGKEVYSDVLHYFTLGGSVSPFVIKRFRGVGLAGIWEKWMNLVSKGYEENKSNTESPKPASINGNILVVFVVWLGGLGLAFTFILSEKILGCFCLELS